MYNQNIPGISLEVYVGTILNQCYSYVSLTFGVLLPQSQLSSTFEGL